jgi:predicted amidohydrolase
VPRVVLAQLAPAAGDPETNLATVAEVISAHPDADLALFPELFASGYRPDRAHADALAAADPAFAVVSLAARQARVAALVGFAERCADGAVANAVACIDRDGSWAGTYRKTHVFGAAERATFVPGDALQIVELADLRVAPLVCFDMEFPEPARALAQAGAQLLATVAANMEPYGPDHELAARARALDNRRPHVYVNRVGAEAGLRFVGGSMACDAAGRVLCALGDDERVACVDVDLAEPAESDVDYLRHVRPDLRVEHSLTITSHEVELPS